MTHRALFAGVALLVLFTLSAVTVAAFALGIRPVDELVALYALTASRLFAVVGPILGLIFADRPRLDASLGHG